MRWLHIYLSMFGLAVTVFFGATGLTLNHPDWFFGEAGRTVSDEGTIDPAWLHREPSSTDRTAKPVADPDGEVARLEIVEHLRQAHGLKGALAEFRVDEYECLVAFKGPGYAADAFIDRATGHYELTQSLHGIIAIINDLHKGRDTGPAWSVVIDISAILMVVIAFSGLILLFYLKLRRVPGLVVALIGAAVVAAVVVFGVP